VWRERGAVVIDADQLAREAVAPGTRGHHEIALRWRAVIAADGTLDRAALARIVFADAGERVVLNGIVHPRVRALARAREAEAPDGSIVVHVVPLLFEGEYWRTVDATAVIIAPDEARIARVIERDGLDRASVLERMRAQIDPAEARRRATYAIDNDADLATLRARADAVYDRLEAR
jgi:dephospho-CoA kinase